jgi:hypothetical protein
MVTPAIDGITARVQLVSGLRIESVQNNMRRNPAAGVALASLLGIDGTPRDIPSRCPGCLLRAPCRRVPARPPPRPLSGARPHRDRRPLPPDGLHSLGAQKPSQTLTTGHGDSRTIPYVFKPSPSAAGSDLRPMTNTSACKSLIALATACGTVPARMTT